jgi:hypothetical protein
VPLSRRISRLRTEPPDRQPVLVVGALVIGLLVGLVTVPRLFSGLDSKSENYVLLASTLYQQGESPSMLRDRLTSVGIAQPATTVLTLAQRYAGSRDKKQQHQAEMLDAFGKVLLNPDLPAASAPAPTAVAGISGAAAGAPAGVPTGTAVAVGTVTTLSTPIGARPTQTGPAPLPSVAAGQPGAPAVGTPVAGAPAPAGTPGPNAAQPGAGQPGAAPAAGSTPAPAGTPGAIQRGRVKPPGGGSARLRSQPSTEGGTLSLIPNAAQVEILETVRGQEYEGETRWLRVRYGTLTGYVSSKLVVVGE